MTENGGGNQKQCSKDEDDWGYDCYGDDSSSSDDEGFPHREMKVEIDGSTKDKDRNICLMLLIEDADGVYVPPTETAPPA